MGRIALLIVVAGGWRYRVTGDPPPARKEPRSRWDAARRRQDLGRGGPVLHWDVGPLTARVDLASVGTSGHLRSRGILCGPSGRPVSHGALGGCLAITCPVSPVGSNRVTLEDPAE